MLADVIVRNLLVWSHLPLFANMTVVCGSPDQYHLKMTDRKMVET